MLRQKTPVFLAEIFLDGFGVVPVGSVPICHARALRRPAPALRPPSTLSEKGLDLILRFERSSFLTLPCLSEDFAELSDSPEAGQRLLSRCHFPQLRDQFDQVRVDFVI